MIDTYYRIVNYDITSKKKKTMLHLDPCSMNAYLYEHVY